MNRFAIILLFFPFLGFSQVLENNNSDISVNGNAVIIFNNISIDNDGDFHDNATNLIEFKGNSGVGLDGTTLTFQKFKLSNSGGVTLQAPLTITNTLTFSTGVMVSALSKELIINDNAIVTGVSDASHVFGPVKKVGDDDFTFPVGNGIYYRPIAISGLLASDTFTAQYYSICAHSIADTTLKPPTIKAISKNEYWDLTRTGAVDAYVTWTWSSSTSGGINDYSSLILAHWNGAAWELIDGTPIGTNASGSYTTTNKMTSFSPQAPGTTSLNNVLPIKLTDFLIYQELNETYISWVTESETNNDYFELERSSDGINFTTITIIQGAGTSRVEKEYSYIEDNPSINAYYRLKQVDFDGTYTYSRIISLQSDFANSISYQIIKEGLWYEHSQNKTAYKCQIIDNQGRIINESLLPPTPTLQKVIDLNKGIFIVRTLKNNEVINITSFVIL